MKPFQNTRLKKYSKTPKNPGGTPSIHPPRNRLPQILSGMPHIDLERSFWTKNLPNLTSNLRANGANLRQPTNASETSSQCRSEGQERSGKSMPQPYTPVNPNSLQLKTAILQLPKMSGRTLQPSTTRMATRLPRQRKSIPNCTQPHVTRGSSGIPKF